MIVAIFSSGVGLTPVEEFRAGANVSAVVDAFQNERTPPATGFDGLDTGWDVKQDAGEHLVWYVDRNAAPGPALLAVPEVPGLTFSAAISLSNTTVLATTWGLIDGVVSQVGGFVDDASDAVGSVSGYVKVDGGSFKMRLCKGEPCTPISDEYIHGDTGGVWEFFRFFSNVDPDLARQVYTVEGALIAPATSAEFRFGSLSILTKDW